MLLVEWVTRKEQRAVAKEVCDIMGWLEEPKGMQEGLEYHFYYFDIYSILPFITIYVFIHFRN